MCSTKGSNRVEIKSIGGTPKGKEKSTVLETPGDVPAITN